LLILSLLQAHVLDQWDLSEETVEQALAEAGDDERFRAELERQVGWSYAARTRALEAEPHVRIALELAEALGDRVLLAEALGAYVSVEFMRGRGLKRELVARALELDTLYEHARVFRHPYWALRNPLEDSGDIAGARVAIQALLCVAEERGEENAPPWLLWALSQIEHDAEEWALALAHAEEAHDLAIQTKQETPRRNALGQRARTWAHVGRIEDARHSANVALTSDSDNDRIVARGVLGFIELSRADPAAAARHLEPAISVARDHGVEDPSVFPIWADAIEAFIGSRQLERALPILEWLEERGRTLDRPWALATSARCRALLSAAKGDLAGALAAVETALREHERLLPRQFELGRTLLVKGRIARRVKQRRVAREALERAVEIFDELGAPLWSKQAGDELGRIGGRASGSALTPTQARIAELVAAGHTNREIADEMFVSVKTVEANLSKIYRKLGVSSRRELARSVGAGDGVGAVEQR
jgi:DNA-binding CsgD family transcriptional regulator